MRVLTEARNATVAINACNAEYDTVQKIMNKRKDMQQPCEPALLTKMARLLQELDICIERFARTQLEACQLISCCSPLEQTVLRDYYLLGMSWEQTADDIFYSLRKVFLVRKGAIACCIKSVQQAAKGVR